MSDVAFARAPWPLKVLFVIAWGIMALVDLLPVLVTRGRYKRLVDNELMLDAAHAAIGEAARLRNKYEPESEVVRLSRTDGKGAA